MAGDASTHKLVVVNGIQYREQDVPKGTPKEKVQTLAAWQKANATKPEA